MTRATTKEEIVIILSRMGYFFIDDYWKDCGSQKIKRVVFSDSFGYKYDGDFRNLLKGHVPRFVGLENSFTLRNIIIWLEVHSKTFKLHINNEYLGNHKKLSFRCLLYNDVFNMSWHNIFSGQGCYYCSGHKVSDRNRLSLIFPEIANEWNYEINKDSPYDISYGSNNKRYWICKKGHESYSAVVVNRTKRGDSCPICASSKGEKQIQTFAENNFISYISEYSFSECKNINPLPFDFYLPKYNLCIEYHGEQHYKPVDFGGKGVEWAKEKFKDQKKRDKIKKKYCKDKNISLLIVPYWEFDNIEQILTEVLL